MNKTIFVLILLSIFGNSILSGQEESKIPTGNWLCQSEYGSVGLKFISDKQLVYDSETFNYKISGNTLKIYSDFVWVDYPFELNNRQLIIDFPEGYRLLFNKVNETPSTANTGDIKSVVKGAEGRYLSGTLCEYGSSSSYSGSSYSHTNRLYFDGRGNFKYGTESSYSGSAGSAYGGNNASDSGTYRISGNQVILTAGDGSVYTLKINFIQDDGQITELYYGEQLYSAGLCD
jgi:hypothetical protein